MQRALVIRTYGDQEIAKTLASTIESAELKKLRAQLGVKSYARDAYYLSKLKELPQKYPIRRKNPVVQKFWALYGFLWALIRY